MTIKCFVLIINFFSQGKPCFDCIKRNNFRSCLNKRCIKNSWSKSLIGYLEGKWQKDFLKIIDKIDIFLAPSLFIKRKAISAGLPAKKIIHLPNFIDNEFLNNKKIKNEFNPQKYILYFGRLSEEKGIDLLIKSYLENSVKLSKWIIKIAGEGPEQDRLKKLNKRYKQIEFLGKRK